MSIHKLRTLQPQPAPKMKVLMGKAWKSIILAGERGIIRDGMSFRLPCSTTKVLREQGDDKDAVNQMTTSGVVQHKPGNRPVVSELPALACQCADGIC